LKDGDARRAGRAFSAAAVELALASYPGCTLLGPPGDATPYGIFDSKPIPQAEVPHRAVLPDGTSKAVPPPDPSRSWTVTSAYTPVTVQDRGRDETRPGPLGSLVGARSGDKGADANLGVWARDDASHDWLRGFLTVQRLKELLPETAPLTVERYDLPNLRAVNFVLRGLLGAGGVAASTRFDPQAKALGELLRARHVEIPVRLL
jgi:hypothetical protein